MSRFERRVRALEQKTSGHGPVVFVFPRATSPEHRFHSDEAYYQDLAENTYGRNDFSLAVWPGNDNRTEPKLLFVEDVSKLLKDVRDNSTRAGVDPELHEMGDQ